MLCMFIIVILPKTRTCLVKNDENGQNNYKVEKSPTHQIQNELVRNKLFFNNLSAKVN